MKSEKLILETPYGTRDLLPGDAAEMRNMEDMLSRLFCTWGYDEVITPTIEHLETLAPRIPEENSLFMLLGNKNKLLALRNEMTTPIARLVSSRLKDAPVPLKLSYLGNVFRVEQTQMGRQCEFHQAGVELKSFRWQSSPFLHAESRIFRYTWDKSISLMVCWHIMRSRMSSARSSSPQ